MWLLVVRRAGPAAWVGARGAELLIAETVQSAVSCAAGRDRVAPRAARAAGPAGGSPLPLLLSRLPARRRHGADMAAGRRAAGGRTGRRARDPARGRTHP